MIEFFLWQNVYHLLRDREFIKINLLDIFRSILGYFSTLVTHFRSYISKDWELQYHLLANIYC